MLIKRTPRPIKSGEGAQVGAMAGLIAAGVYLVISIPLIILAVGERFQQAFYDQMSAWSNNPELQEMMRKAIEQSENQTTEQRLVNSIPVLIQSRVVFVCFCMIGQ